MRTDQELYTTVRRHLLTQMKKAEVEIDSLGGSGKTTRCSYRTPEGLMCAVGCLIPDTNYDPALEGFGCSTSQVTKAAGLSFAQSDPNTNPMGIAVSLQTIHDLDEPEDWRKLLDAEATKRGLIIED